MKRTSAVEVSIQAVSPVSSSLAEAGSVKEKKAKTKKKTKSESVFFKLIAHSPPLIPYSTR